MIPARRPDPLAPPLSESTRRYFLRIHAGGLLVCGIGIVAGVFLQKAHDRGQAGLILALVSGMLGVLFAFGLVSDRWGER